MSGSTGSAAAGTAGPSTFSQPNSPTQGLQRYDLEPGVKNLVPDTAVASKFREGIKRLAALRRDQARRASARQTRGSHAALKKDFSMNIGETIEAMVGTLSTSVADIQASGGDKVQELLAKSFTEFKGALLEAVNDNAAELAKRAAEEDPLHKGLGLVGRAADLLSCIAGKVEAIRAGYDSKWQMPSENATNAAKPTDVPSEDIIELLDGIVHMAELTLRAAVNQHVQLADDADLAEGAVLPPGMHLIMVPDADDAAAGAVVKTMLPEDLAKYATDPAVLSDGIVERGAALMLTAGVPEEALHKMFEVESDELNKAFPPKKGKNADGSDATGATAAGDGTATVDDTDPNGGADQGSQGDPTGANGGMGDPNSDDPVAVALRICAALMIQLDHIHQLVTGGASDMTGQDANDTSDQGVGGDGTTQFGKSASGMGLAKRVGGAVAAAPSAELAALKKQIEDLNDQLAKRDADIGDLAKGVNLLLAQPAPAKGITGPAATVALTKQADGAAPALPTVEQMEAELAKMAPDQRVLELIKMSQKLPEPNARRA